MLKLKGPSEPADSLLNDCAFLTKVSKATYLCPGYCNGVAKDRGVIATNKDRRFRAQDELQPLAGIAIAQAAQGRLP